MKKKSSGGCSSLLFTLFFVFIILKLAGAIAWSWWWVTAPLWMPAALLAGGIVLAAVMGVSVFKIVSTVLHRQRFRQSVDGEAARTEPQGAHGPVVEAEGTEVTSRPAGGDPRALPRITSSAESEDSSG